MQTNSWPMEDKKRKESNFKWSSGQFIRNSLTGLNQSELKQRP